MLYLIITHGGLLPGGLHPGGGGLHPGDSHQGLGGIGQTPARDTWDTTGYGQQAGSTHPTGMHSCFSADL